MLRFLRIVACIVALLVVGGALLAGIGYVGARQDPAVRPLRIALRDWPRGVPAQRIVLISDIHIGSAAMDAARLARIVGQINTLRPDAVLIAGDFIAGHRPGDAAARGPALVEPLARLRAPLGVWAVPGNHDHWTGLPVLKRLLQRARVRVIANGAAQVGPIALGGIDDDFSHHADVAATLAQLQRIDGPRLMLTHSPDILPRLPPGTILLAGHTHCGQVVLPLYGSLLPVSRFGDRLRCGVHRLAGRTAIVTAGLGTSGGPFRIGAPPDLWLLTVGG